MWRVLLIGMLVVVTACGDLDTTNGTPGAPLGEEEQEQEQEAEDLGPVPEPNRYEGSGDDLVAVEPPEPGPLTFHITGNQEGRHFAVTAYTGGGDRVTLLVNTTDPYAGITLDMTGNTRELEISATGGWTVEVHAIRGATTVPAPGEIDGGGDFVFVLNGTPSSAQVTGNPAARHFAILAYGSGPGGRDLLVNTTDPYEGRVRVSPGAQVVEVTAVGEWSIIFE